MNNWISTKDFCSNKSVMFPLDYILIFFQYNSRKIEEIIFDQNKRKASFLFEKINC